jgi:hypothetical protein
LFLTARKEVIAIINFAAGLETSGLVYTCCQQAKEKLTIKRNRAPGLASHL